MSLPLTRSKYNGFRLDGTLASKLHFTGIIRVWMVDRLEKKLPDKDVVYWSVKDENGARLSTFDESIAKKLTVNERFVVSGDIKIGKGGTFLNIIKAEVFHGSEYRDTSS